VVVKVCEVGLYSLSSSVGWKAGDPAASDVSLALGENFSVVVPPSHQHYASSSHPAPVASWLDCLGWRPDPG